MKYIFEQIYPYWARNYYTYLNKYNFRAVLLNRNEINTVLFLILQIQAEGIANKTMESVKYAATYIP